MTTQRFRVVDGSSAGDHDTLFDDRPAHAEEHRRPARFAEGTPAPVMVNTLRPAPISRPTPAPGAPGNVLPFPPQVRFGDTAQRRVSGLASEPPQPARPTPPVPMNNVSAETLFMPTIPAPPRGSSPALPDEAKPAIPPGPTTAKTLLGMAAFPSMTGIASGSIVPTRAPSEPKVVVRPSTTEIAPPAPITETKPEEAKEPAGKWAEFEKIGLAPKTAKAKAGGVAQKLVVSTYRLIGFAILTLIVVVLLGYIGTTAFYYFNTTWATPVAVSGSDEKVVALKAQLAQAQTQRDRISAELDDTDRAIAAQQDFQSEFAKAIQSDLKGRQQALGRVRQLASQAEQTRSQIRHANEDYAADYASKSQKEYDAGLIDRSAMLSGKYQLAQISTSNLSLAERQAEFEQRAAQLSAETRALDAVLAGKDGALTYDVLKIKDDYVKSKLELARAMQNRKVLQTSLGRQDDIIKGIQESALLRVISDHAVVAQVPYENLKNISAGTKLYSCRVQMVWCSEVGEVLEVLPGEVTFKHPHREAQVRGQLVEMKLTDPDAAAKNVLFLGSEPLWF